MPLMINCVWLNNAAMGPLEQFNVYSWKALGHKVNVYAIHWDGRAPSVATLGLSKLKDDKAVFNLKTLVEDDNLASNAAVPSMREVLKSWYAKGMKHAPDLNFVFSMADLSKSYVFSTQAGIVLDMKVGPSPHLQAYEPVFSQKFISFTRSTNTIGAPENQCIGTMEAGFAPTTIRGKYAAKFEEKTLAGKEQFIEKTNEKHCATLTGYHGWAAKATRKWLDVATQKPDGGEVKNEYKVEEIQGDTFAAHGPFRVFKRADDQTLKETSIKTSKLEQQNLARKAYAELSVKQGVKQDYIALMNTALSGTWK